MNLSWDENITLFLRLSQKYQVKMLMVGGGAVNFHGYQRHSADVDFWIDVSDDNLKRLLQTLNEMGYEISDFPEKVKNKEQNISIKFSPIGIDLELITNFSIGKSFDEAYSESKVVTIKNQDLVRWNVLSLEDLILSKMKAGRPKDYLDIQELQRIQKL